MSTFPTTDWGRTTMLSHIRQLGLAAVVLLLAGACSDLEAPNFNAGDLEELQDNPTRASISAAVTGLTITTRKVYAEDDNDMIAMLGILGRENYVLDVADPRFVSEMLGGELNPGSPAFGGNFWSRPYQNVRIADVVLNGLDGLPAGEMTDAEKNATRGFVRTWKALDLLIIAQTRDLNCDGSLGCPVEVTEDPEDLAPALERRAVYDEIERLLDAGADDLSSGGGAFPFELHGGFAGFDTPETFAQFNRALAARVDVYIASIFDEPAKYTEALNEDLPNSFMDVDGDFERGVYHAFSTGSGDTPNGLFQPSADPNYRAHPSIRDSARAQEDGDLVGDREGVTPDQRFLDKTRPITFRTFQQVGSDIGIDIYDSPASPAPIVRNEELVLLAAEAHIGLNELEEAEPFLNEVRTRSGGLPEVDLSSMTQEEARSELLYDKRYSLFAEGGHHWIDLRRYDRIGDLPLDLETHRRNARYPVPLDEQLARGGG